jgi:microcompartment protein CcmK/EutM
VHISKVVGMAVSTVKDSRLEGSKLLLVADADPTGKVLGKPYVALDLVGAGEGELVIVVQGSSARVASGDANKPVDATIVGILDSLRHNQALTFKKS